MKKNLNYNIHPKYVVRAPIFPFNFIVDILSNQTILVENLKRAVQLPVVTEALYIASPDFYEQVQKWLIGKVSDSKEEEKILQTIYKYISRMSSRSTPFGLFAGCTMGITGEYTEIDLSDIKDHERHTRLDMSFLCNLAYYLSCNESIRIKLHYFPNTSIYKVGEKIRYIEYRYKKDYRTHHLVEIKNSFFLEKILIESKTGRTINELIQLLIRNEIPTHQANDFIQQLITNQILVSELDPSVTGEEFLNRIIKILAPIENIIDIKGILNVINEKLKCLDIKVGNSIDKYYDIIEDIKKLNIDYNKRFLFQTDLILPSKKIVLQDSIMQSIKEGVAVFNKFTEKSSNTKMSLFAEAFYKRYETRECPLLKILDTEIGIGYLQKNRNSDGDFSPLISDIIIPTQEDPSLPKELNKIQQFLFHKFLNAQSKNDYEIELKENDITAFEIDWSDLPPTFSAIVKIIEGPNSKFANGRILIEGVGLCSATQLLGRFCYGDPKLLDYANEIAKIEREIFSDALLAEVVHLPESRVGNIILRPIFQDYEIPFLTFPSVDPEHTITLDDLYISIHNNEVILRSKKLNKRIIPRLSNAHNYSYKALPVYQFLCDLQNQNLRYSLSVNLGSLINSFPFRPRVIYKNLILIPASWTIMKEEIADFYKIKEDNTLIKEINIWREKKNMPLIVLFEEEDNKLLVFLNSLLSIKTFLTTIKKLKSFRLCEFLFNPNNALLKNNEGIFMNEFILTIYKESNRND